jgi:hypothetical protein
LYKSIRNDGRALRQPKKTIRDATIYRKGRNQSFTIKAIETLSYNMNKKEKGKVETVNLPPSAAGMLDGYLTIIRTEATASPVYKAAMKELRHIAEMADMYAFEKTGHLPDEWL